MGIDEILEHYDSHEIDMKTYKNLSCYMLRTAKEKDSCKYKNIYLSKYISVGTTIYGDESSLYPGIMKILIGEDTRHYILIPK